MRQVVKRSIFLLCMLLVIWFDGVSQDWKVYPYTPTGSLISFPEDEGRHTVEPIEWWYVCGHLTGETSGSHYSFMVSYFYYPAYFFDGFRILNISNDDNDFFYSETGAVNYDPVANDSLNIIANIYLGGTETFRNRTDQDGKTLPFEYVIESGSAPNKLTLEINALKPPLILADSGFLYQGSTDYTYYYSLPYNSVEGSVIVDGISENVSGTAWIDKQYGTFNPSTGIEYEWFCVQLSNGVELNLNNIFTDDDRVPDTLTYRLLAVSVDEQVQYTTSDLEIERQKYSYMEDSLRCYSQVWRISSRINGLDIILTAVKNDTEVKTPFRFYEGSVVAQGVFNGTEVTGKGFAELLHTYEKPRISTLDTLGLQNNEVTVKWKLDNPDDGNPLLYDLDYSLDGMLTFQNIDEAITDTSITWSTSVLSAENEVWLRLRSYSVDNTIVTITTTKLGSGQVAVPEVFPDNEYRIYPNPSSGLVIIEGPGIQKIDVIDLSGRLIRSFNTNSVPMILDLGFLQKGIYYLSLETTERKYIRKLILK